MQPGLTYGGVSTRRTSVHADDCPYKYCGGYVVYRKARLYRSLADGLQNRHPAHIVRAGDRVYVDAEIRGKERWLRVARPLCRRLRTPTPLRYYALLCVAVSRVGR